MRSPCLACLWPLNENRAIRLERTPPREIDSNQTIMHFLWFKNGSPGGRDDKALASVGSLTRSLEIDTSPDFVGHVLETACDRLTAHEDSLATRRSRYRARSAAV
jgi:hypothetical protein